MITKYRKALSGKIANRSDLLNLTGLFSVMQGHFL